MSSIKGKSQPPKKNIAVNDWVTNGTGVGQVVNQDENSNQGELWIKWSGDSLPMSEPAGNLRLLAYNGKDLAGTSLPNREGYCHRLVYVEHTVQVKVHLEQKKKPEIWSLEKFTNKLKDEKQSLKLSSSSSLLPLKKIRRDGGTQPRAFINHQMVLEYSEDMKNGDSFPPVIVFFDGSNYWLADGFHRLEAALGAGFTDMAVTVKQGTKRDAILYSVGANAKHGLRRTNADKRRAVMRLLEDSEWSQWSVSEIARQGKVSRPFVYKIIEENSHLSTFTSERTYKTKHGTQAKMNTTNIGKSKTGEPSTSTKGKEVIFPQQEENQEVTPLPVNQNIYTNKRKTDPELQDSTNPQLSEGEPAFTNQVSIGDKVKVKTNHFFAGQVGTVTQLTSPNKVIVALENGQRDLILLNDLDLVPKGAKSLVDNDSKPKLIMIKEGLNYQAGEDCSWYIRVPERDYKLFQQVQQQHHAPSISSYLVRLVEEKQQQALPPPSDDILVNISSKITHLNQEQKLFLAQKLIESDSELFNRLRGMFKRGEDKDET